MNTLLIRDEPAARATGFSAIKNSQVTIRSSHCAVLLRKGPTDCPSVGQV